MNALPRPIGILLAAAFAAAGLANAAGQPPIPEEAIKASVEALRNRKADHLYAPGKHPVKDDVQHARDAIRAYGGPGLSLVKAETEKVLASPVQDAVFLQEAAALAWAIGGDAEADYILSLWRAIPLESQSNGVYYAVLDAAHKQTPAALPLMTYCLANHRGEFFTPERGIHIQWPNTVKMVWAAYGPAGMPVLDSLLRSPAAADAKVSAVNILAQAHYLPALPAIRDLARRDPSPVLRQAAYAALGQFGHPDDFELLTAGLAALDGEDLWVRAFALFEYEDLRAVPLLAPRLAAKGKDARLEVLFALAHLPTPASLQALHDYCAAPADKREERTCKLIQVNLHKEMGMEMENYLALPMDEQQRRAGALVGKMNARYRPTPGKSGFDRAAFRTLQAGWREGKPFLPAGFEGLALGDFLHASAPEDLPLYYQAIAAEYRTMTEESWGDVYTLEDLIKRVGRARYRREVGLTAKVIAP